MRFATRFECVIALASVVLGAVAAGAVTCGDGVECGCGDTVVGGTVLTHDLVDCADDGLRLVGSAVLDCAGHEIRGSSSGEGVLLDEAEGAIVRDCHVADFKTGVRIRGGAGNRLEGSEITHNRRYGVELARATSGNRLEGNLIVGSGDEGIHVGTGADENEVVGNEIRGSHAENLYVLSANGGMYEENLLAESGGAAIYVKHASDGDFSRNEVRDKLVQVRGASYRNQFEQNELRGGRFQFEAYRDKKHPDAVRGWTRPTGNLVVGGSVLDTKTCFRFKGVSDNHAMEVVSNGCRPLRESKKGGERAVGNTVSLVEEGVGTP